MAELELAKYEALGNDFLILVDWERAGRFDAELAVALCDRHRGIGADGWLRLSAPDRRGALAEARRHGLGVEAFGHAARLPAPRLGRSGRSRGVSGGMLHGAAGSWTRIRAVPR